MKKLLAIIFVGLFLFTSCGGGGIASGSSAKSIDGKWVYDGGEDYKETLSIEGENALLTFWAGEPCKGTVDAKEHTITFTNMLSDKDYIFDYEVINDQIVLTLDPDKNNGETFRTMAFEKAEETEKTEDK